MEVLSAIACSLACHPTFSSPCLGRRWRQKAPEAEGALLSVADRAATVALDGAGEGADATGPCALRSNRQPTPRPEGEDR